VALVHAVTNWKLAQLDHRPDFAVYVCESLATDHFYRVAQLADLEVRVVPRRISANSVAFDHRALEEAVQQDLKSGVTPLLIISTPCHD
jgi:glutamate/tyrosine decarboxylase-like PLP-dependent enzyme